MLLLLRLSHSRIWLSRSFAVKPGGIPSGQRSLIAKRMPSEIGFDLIFGGVDWVASF
jgi:hypothetical protein